MSWIEELADAVMATRTRLRDDEAADLARLQSRRVELQRILAETEHVDMVQVEVDALQQIVKRNRDQLAALAQTGEALAAELRANIERLSVIVARRAQDYVNAMRDRRLECDFGAAIEVFRPELAAQNCDPAEATPAQLETALARVVSTIEERRRRLMERVIAASEQLAELQALDEGDAALAVRAAELEREENAVRDKLANHAKSGQLPPLVASICEAQPDRCKSFRDSVLLPILHDLDIEQQFGLYGHDPLRPLAAELQSR